MSPATTASGPDLFDLGLFADGPPHDVFRRLRRESPVCFLPEPDGPGYWGVFGYDDVFEVSRHPQTFGSHPNTMIKDPDDGGAETSAAGEAGLARSPDEPPLAAATDGVGEIMLNADPPRHTKLRKLVNKGFTPRQINALEPRIRQRVIAILDAAAAKGSFDLVTDVAVEVPLQVIAELVGVPEDERHQVFAWTERMMSLDDPELGGTLEDARTAMAEMFAYADRLAAERATGDGSDLLSVLLRAEVDGDRLTPMDVDLFFMLLMNAGSETTRNLITGGMLTLFEHPDEHERLRREPGVLPTAIEEMLRWVTPVTHFRRTARADTELAGQGIREGDKVVMWYSSANRDESHFEDADRFDVGRTPNEHVAFGAGGPHFCLGASLARLEARVMFEELMARMPGLEPAGPVRRLGSNFINGIKALPVRVA